MSTNTNIANMIDHGIVPLSDERDLNGCEFSLYIGNKRITAQFLSQYHPEMQVSRNHWRTINAASLWGFLRRYHVDGVLITYTEPLLVVVLVRDNEEGTAYFRITWVQWWKLVYCFLDQSQNIENQSQLDWKTVGF